MCRHGVYAICYRCTTQRSCSQVLIGAVDRLPTGKCAMRSNRNRIGVVSISVIGRPVVNVVYVGDIGVVNVDVVPVARSRVIPRMEWLAPTKREPSDTESHPKPHAKSESTTQKPNERGSIVRTCVNRAWAPAPASATIDPATVVIR